MRIELAVIEELLKSRPDTGVLSLPLLILVLLNNRMVKGSYAAPMCYLPKRFRAEYTTRFPFNILAVECLNEEFTYVPLSSDVNYLRNMISSYIEETVAARCKSFGKARSGLIGSEAPDFHFDPEWLRRHLRNCLLIDAA
jgi:hypothetical protein